ncbi:MAG: abortive infection system antitoxin AbiGi family protein, partial [Candidatus Hodarchaeota archaeon]
MSLQYGLEDFLQRFATKVLWHFTGYNKNDEKAFLVLKKILEDRELKLGEYCPEVIMPISGEKRWGHPCSCMCDIPFKDLRIHTRRYGKYGIAFDKNKAITKGHFNPVLYIHKDHILFKHVEEKLLGKIDELTRTTGDYGKRLYEYLVILGTYIKRSDLTASVSDGNPFLDDQQDNNFYYEREWRSAYSWKFKNEDIEAIMIQRKDIEDINNF